MDGYCCDVAHMVPVDFWEQVRTEREKVKPEGLLLAEASPPQLLYNGMELGDASEYGDPALFEKNPGVLETQGTSATARCSATPRPRNTSACRTGRSWNSLLAFRASA